MIPTVLEWLSGPGKEACAPAREWLATLPAESTMDDAWLRCPRADWMFWAGARSPVPENDPRWRQAALAIVRRTPVGDGTCWDTMPAVAQHCVEVAEAFERGEATAEERSAALTAARSAALTAALTAARCAALTASLTAARCAESAALTAARSAAESAALTAAWCALTAATSHESAALAAAWCARSAAARSAALTAARSAQATIIREFVPHPWGEE